MQTFNWKAYLENYPDLQLAGINTREKALRHYKRTGQKEQRSDQPGITTNTLLNLGGRFGNILFYTFVADYISRKNDILITYNEIEKIKSLGIDLHEGTKRYEHTLVLTDENVDNIFSIFENPLMDKNLIIGGYFQTPTVARYIKETIHKESIIEKNPYKNRYPCYTGNNDVFVHIRLGDILDFNAQEEYIYYEQTLSKIIFDRGFISSDSPDHIYCKNLIEKFNLYPFQADEINTIQFASTCKSIVLSKGTFSWFIGVLAFYSEIFFPDKIGMKPWHGDIFVFPEWNKVTY